MPTPTKAQLFQASSSGDLNKPFHYALTIDDIHAYAHDKQGTFPLSIVFSDTLQWDMELEQYDVRHENYRFFTSTGRTRQAEISSIVTYRGNLAGKPESQVRMTLTDDYFRALVYESSETAYYVEMAHLPSVVKIMKEDPEAEPAFCASHNEHHIHTPRGVNKSNGLSHTLNSGFAPYEAEIAFVVDRLGAAQFGTLEELELELLTILNYTDAAYESLQLTYKLTDVLVYEDEQSQPWDESSDAGRMLENFTSWASGNTPLQHHDVATLWSGINFGQTVGIAWIGAIGSPYRQNVVNFKQGSDQRNANIHAHELGHNWGADHVNSAGWMMSAFLSSGNEAIPWNQSTVNAFPGFIDNAMDHLEDVGDDGDSGEGVLTVGYGELMISGDENGSGLLDPGETANVNLVLENMDANPISNLQVTMTQDNNRAKNHVTINSDPVVVENLGANASIEISFNVTLSLLAPVDRSYRFLFELTDGARVAETTRSFTSGDELLPVDLTSFTAFESGTGVVLEWETASELNNAGFEIEMQEGSGEFRRVAFVEGAGTTLDPQLYSFRLAAIGPGAFGFRLKQIDFDGGFEYSDVITLTLLPDVFSLKQNYPNPFNPQTRIEFLMPSDGDVLLEVYDMLGRRVAILVNEYLQAGQHAALFDGENLPNGTYVYRLKSGGFEETRTMILMK